MPVDDTLTELTTTGTMTIPEAGFTLRSISVRSDGAPSIGDTYTITVFIDGSPSALEVVLTNANGGQANFTLPSPIPLVVGWTVNVFGLPAITSEPDPLPVSATVGFGVSS